MECSKHKTFKLNHCEKNWLPLFDAEADAYDTKGDAAKRTKFIYKSDPLTIFQLDDEETGECSVIFQATPDQQKSATLRRFSEFRGGAAPIRFPAPPSSGSSDSTIAVIRAGGGGGGVCKYGEECRYGHSRRCRDEHAKRKKKEEAAAAAASMAVVSPRFHYLYAVHHAVNIGGRRRYLHRFVMMERCAGVYGITHVSEVFKFPAIDSQNNAFQYIMGFTLDHDDRNLIMCIGEDDIRSALFSMSISDVHAMLKPVASWPACWKQDIPASS